MPFRLSLLSIIFPMRPTWLVDNLHSSSFPIQRYRLSPRRPSWTALPCPHHGCGRYYFARLHGSPSRQPQFNLARD
ncbi:hypothetical protein F5141DRAFT_1087358 [Pisolithus sp. B1]|nr:hypothetical protein F5141DRAFT_1142145 [Pisolithus sp. B1]KAI6121063.1 hypothetical protein F5141DRAFT_1087358 [Pisolithus sp. B1]